MGENEKSFKPKISRDNNSKTIYKELKPILILSRIFGFAPFHVVGTQVKSSKLYAAQNVFFVAVIFYYTWTSETVYGGRNPRSALSVLFFKAIAVSKNAYAVICLLHFAFRTKVCIDVWTVTEEVNALLTGINVEGEFNKNRTWCYLKTLIFLLAFACFAVSYSVTMSEPFTLAFCVEFFVPSFNNYLLIFYFSMLTTNLKNKCRSMNKIFREEIAIYKKRRRVGSGFDFVYRNRGQEFSLLRKVRTLKIMHLKMYKVVKNLDGLFGVHFLYLFVMYFCLGSLHSFTIIRHISEYTSRVLFLESVYSMTMETVQIIFAVHGCSILDKEVKSFCSSNALLTKILIKYFY